jgi:hypothetical protein
MYMKTCGTPAIAATQPLDKTARHVKRDFDAALDEAAVTGGVKTA